MTSDTILFMLTSPFMFLISFSPLIAWLITAYSVIKMRNATFFQSLFSIGMVIVMFVTALFIPLSILFAGGLAYFKTGRNMLVLMSFIYFTISSLYGIGVLSNTQIDPWLASFVSLFIFYYMTMYIISLFVLFVKRAIRLKLYYNTMATYQGFQKRGFYYYHIFTYEVAGILYENNASSVEYFKWEEKFSRVKCEVSQERVIYVNPKKHEKFIV